MWSQIIRKKEHLINHPCKFVSDIYLYLLVYSFVVFWLKLSSLSTRTKFRNTGVKTLDVKRRKPMFTIKTGIGEERRISCVGLCNIIPLSSTTNYKSSSIRVQVYHVQGSLSVRYCSYAPGEDFLLVLVLPPWFAYMLNRSSRMREATHLPRP